ncbi:DegT/DnrJ/EryC1/StrS family aminotransferase [Streptacidiphilus sp. N1-10]|uniref:DegT/DnrJ/EryC1/StrS family aminotransferase n=1 Tax=Streptacidiphilus jeojiensis TaxID=3229225 RepID=A0ABV6XHK5_9ACTN
MSNTITMRGSSRNSSPFLYGTEADAVARVLAGGQYGHTEVTEEFEDRIARFLGVPEAVAVSSGTAALHTALLVAGVGPGDEVILPSLTFCATVQAVLACGATPRFADIDPTTVCLEPGSVLDALNPATKAVLPVLYGGRAVDLSTVRPDLEERGITVVEDAAQAFGSMAGTQAVGATGALTCFSFGPIKNLTCGQGGMVIPRSPEEAQQARGFRMLGVTQSQAERRTATTYRVDGFGLRYQMSSINAAIGLAQLDRFSETAAARQQLWRTYQEALQEVPGAALVDVDVDRSVPHLCAVLVPDRDAVFRRLHDQGIGVGVHYPPNHLQAAFAPWRRELPVTERVGRQILTLPFHQHLGADEIQYVATALARALPVGRPR